MHTVVMFSVSLTERKLQNEVRMEQPEREAASTAEKKSKITRKLWRRSMGETPNANACLCLCVVPIASDSGIVLII